MDIGIIAANRRVLPYSRIWVERYLRYVVHVGNWAISVHGIILGVEKDIHTVDGSLPQVQYSDCKGRRFN